MGRGGSRVRKRYLYRTLLFVALISLSPVAMIGIMTNLKITKAINQELVEADNQLLSLTVKTVESILSQMKNACVQLKNDQCFTELHKLEADIGWYESYTEFQSEEEMRQMYNYLLIKRQVFDRLYAETVTNGFVESAYYIDLKKEIILTSDSEVYGLEEFYDHRLLPDLNAQLGTWGFIERTASNRNGERQNTISIFYGAKYQGDSQIFVMNLQPYKFYQHLTRTVVNQKRSQLFILQNNKELISDSEVSEQAYMQISNQLETYDNTSAFTREIRIDGMNYYLSGIFSDRLHWWIFNITKANELFEPSNYTMRIMITVCATLAVLICIIILLWSVKWYRPIRRILENLPSHPGSAVSSDTRGQNEMTYIYNSLQHMHMEKKELQERVLQMLPFFQEKYIQSLLQQDEISLEHVEEKFRYLNIPLQVDRICLIMFQIREAIGGDSRGDMKNTVEQNICIQEVIRQVFSQAGKSFFVLMDLDRFTVLVNWNQEGMTGIFHLCEECKAAMRQAAGLHYEVGISRKQPDITGIYQAYREVQQAISCTMFMEGETPAYIEDIVFQEEHGGRKAFRIPISIFAAIRSGKKEEAVTELLIFLKRVTLAYDHLSYERVSNLFLRLLSRLFDLVEELEIQDERAGNLLYQSNKELLGRNELLAMEAMKQAVQRLAEICEERLASKNEDRISGMKAQIEDGYSNSSLSLTDVAEQAGLHPDYLSRIFKEHTGKTFSEYLNYVRLERSTSLLGDTDLKIKEIAVAVGYNNTNYFIKVFKETFGTTPKEYRISFKNMK